MSLDGIGGHSPSGKAKQAQAQSAAPRLVFSAPLGEGVRSLDVGAVALGEYKDLIASTFSGKVVGFTADPAAQDATGAQM